jgi:hypothetical protein
MLLILRRMLDVHQRGKESSAVGISGATGITRTKVNRKRQMLIKMGAIEKHDARYVAPPEFMNVSQRVEGFKHRRDV